MSSCKHLSASTPTPCSVSSRTCTPTSRRSSTGRSRNWVRSISDWSGVTETTGYPALYDAGVCRHVSAELPGARVYRAGQPLTIRVVGNGCTGITWADVPARIEPHGAFSGLVLVDEGNDL